jgi:uncharacterized NAD(P)/FAD-binding protein YdhS
LTAVRERPVVRVAIVGLGPKGTFALERLLAHAGAAAGRARIEVDAFEAHGVPGAGPVYDPRQPAYLRMNFAAEQIDMWRGAPGVPSARRQTFVEWSAANARPCEPGDYPPRADVGRYLADGLATLLADAPPNARVVVRRARVSALRRRGSGWDVSSAEGRRRYDEVLIATGHEPSWDGALANDWRGPARLAPAVFPVQKELSCERVPPGVTVAARGFALTFIDAALALTEGRGGTFAALDHPYRLRYVSSGREPLLILPFSRTGRPMLAKPSRLPAPAAVLAEIARSGSQRLSGLQGAVDLHRDLLPLLASTAAAGYDASIAAAGHHPSIVAAGHDVSGRSPGGCGAHARTLIDWLAGAAAGRPLPTRWAPAQELDRSLAVGAGLAPADLAWALGHTWRALYPALVRTLSGDRLSAAEWPAFRRLAGELERVSFGPPPINAAKLLALIDAGRVDLRHVAGGRLRSDALLASLSSTTGRESVDIALDAVLPGPGASGHGGLVGALIGDGHVRVAGGRRGLDVDPDGSARGADGLATPGLAAIGRPTEDSVIGNDTLNPRLHDVAERWARRVVARAVDDGATARSARAREPAPA